MHRRPPALRFVDDVAEQDTRDGIGHNLVVTFDQPALHGVEVIGCQDAIALQLRDQHGQQRAELVLGEVVHGAKVSRHQAESTRQLHWQNQ